MKAVVARMWGEPALLEYTEVFPPARPTSDRKSTRLNSSHLVISYAVFCLKKKTKQHITIGISTQNTTTTTVTGGLAIKDLHLPDKYVPHIGKNKTIDFTLTWQYSTSAPPI